MPKLRFKDDDKKKKKDKHRHSHHKRHKEKPYKPPTLYEEESGWVPPSTSTKYDPDQAWRERLFEAMIDDEGQDPFYSQYTESYHQPTMDDEEYRQYIVDGMYRRKHADEIAEKERRKAEKERRKQEKERARKEQERLERVYQQLETQRKQESSKASFIEKWNKLESLQTIHKKDVPWPMIGREFTLEAVRQFVIDPTLSEAENKKNVRKEQARYHPDKFVTRYMKRFEGSDKEKERVMTHINEISGFLNELWSQMNTT
ncbi:uncharacterized protein B0P05DRAFT_526930 [Gilbertella persicaria]|uniref:uncharacterized protein n=1 Tax=Gilbertella persicaria TaxID=101096 RepID=UPI0022206EE6|nr:uncharacterized protein B0P05DRAFT_526930 [Gilbertella persicaria]KAI8091306.1 hypothetical protein B0P05DRAFT_526930 [Gilbertella persicaria]